MAQGTPSERLLKPTEVARLLGIHKDTVLEWFRNETLHGFKLPSGAWRMRESDLTRWITALDMRLPTPGWEEEEQAKQHGIQALKEQSEQPPKPNQSIKPTKRVKKPATDPGKLAE